MSYVRIIVNLANEIANLVLICISKYEIQSHLGIEFYHNTARI